MTYRVDVTLKDGSHAIFEGAVAHGPLGNKGIYEITHGNGGVTLYGADDYQSIEATLEEETNEPA